MVATGAASATTASRAPTPDRPPTNSTNSTNYSNVAYSGFVDPKFENKGPPYDPSTASLTAEEQQLANDLRNVGLGQQADQYTHAALTNQKVQGMHSDQETYGHRNLYRTASDTATHDEYHDSEIIELKTTTAAYKAAQLIAGRKDIDKSDPSKHFAVIQASQAAQAAQLQYVLPIIFFPAHLLVLLSNNP
jgi:hypothetical protein